MAKTEQLTIIGSGPSGWTAALYAARGGLNPLVIEGPVPGGQLTQTTEVENFPGYPHGIQGPEMMAEFRQQAEKFGARVKTNLVVDVDFSVSPKVLTLDDGSTVQSEAVIISTGSSAKWLGLKNEQKLKGFGVSACATCDGFFFKGSDVVIVGGGDTAMEEALFLANFANKVYLIHRRNTFRASQIMVDRVLKHDKIIPVYNSVVADVIGDDVVTGVVLENVTNGERSELSAQALFVAIGHTPNSKPFDSYVETDNHGYIKVSEPTTYTNVDGVFAAGDITDLHYRQAITAAGQGCKAAIDAQRWLETRV